MARVIVQHETDGGIAVLLEYVAPNTPGRAQGWYGKCTECGWPMHRWGQVHALAGARRHVERHEAQI